MCYVDDPCSGCWPMTETATTGRVNGAGKRWQCHHCLRTFTKTEHLERHVRSHTKEKPFQCSVCGKSYGRQYAMSCFLCIPNLADESEATLYCAIRKTT